MNTKCTICCKPTVARGLCRTHYYSAHRHGTLGEYTSIRPSLKQRFDALYDKSNSGCWLWKGAKTKSGYGLIWITEDKCNRLAHRVSYALHNGVDPDALDVCHHCDTPLCVNPEHLFVGTRKDNILDCVAKQRNAFGTKNGHSILTDEIVAFIHSLDGLESQKEIAKRYDVNPSVISRIMSGKAWRHITAPVPVVGASQPQSSLP